MNKDQFYKYTLQILKQLKLPFTDPCDASYVGECGPCGGGGGGTFACTDLNGCSLADLGTRDYNDLTGRPTSLGQFINDLTNTDITDSLGYTSLTQNGGNITGTIDLVTGQFTLDSPASTPTWVTEEPAVTGGASTVTLAGTPDNLDQTFVFLGGQKIPNSQLSLAGSVITFNSLTLNTGDVVEVQFVTY